MQLKSITSSFQSSSKSGNYTKLYWYAHCCSQCLRLSLQTTLCFAWKRQTWKYKTRLFHYHHVRKTEMYICTNCYMSTEIIWLQSISYHWTTVRPLQSFCVWLNTYNWIFVIADSVKVCLSFVFIVKYAPQALWTVSNSIMSIIAHLAEK